MKYKHQEERNLFDIFSVPNNQMKTNQIEMQLEGESQKGGREKSSFSFLLLA